MFSTYVFYNCYSLLGLTFAHYLCPFFLSCDIFYFSICFVCCEYCCSGFLWFAFAWIPSVLSLLDLYVSLDLKRVCYRQHICEPCFWGHSICVFLLEHFNPFILKVIINMFISVVVLNLFLWVSFPSSFVFVIWCLSLVVCLDCFFLFYVHIYCRFLVCGSMRFLL